MLSKPSYLFGAAIIAKSSLHATFIHSLSSNNATAINVTLNARVSITYISVYIRPSLPTISETLNPIFQPLKSNDTLSLSVFAIDANAKHVLWNSKRNDVKGLELEHLLSKFPINISNKDLKTLSFAPQNTSFLDLTLHGDKLETSNWIYLDIPSLSDHPYICFSVKPIIPANPHRFRSRNSTCIRLPDSSRTQPQLFQAQITPLLSILPHTEPIRSSYDIDSYISTITTTIQNAAQNQLRKCHGGPRSHGHSDTN